MVKQSNRGFNEIKVAQIIGRYSKVENGWVSYGFNNREQFTPDSLVFKRKSGKMYRHSGRQCSGYPYYNTKDTIISMETETIKVMNGSEFEMFKRS